MGHARGWVRALHALVAWDAVELAGRAAEHGHDAQAFGHLTLSHLPWLDAVLPAPNPAAMLVIRLLLAWLAGLVALGLTRAPLRRLVAGLWWTSLLWSQLEGFQHQVLVGWMLAACALPASLDAPPVGRLSLPRVLSWQMALLYVWTAIAKLGPGWRGGDVPMAVFADAAIGDLVSWAAQALTVPERSLWSMAGPVAAGAELVVAVGFAARRQPIRSLGLVVGVLLHATISVAPLRVGLFVGYLGLASWLLWPVSWQAACASAVATVGRALVGLGRGLMPASLVAPGARGGISAALAMAAPMWWWGSGDIAHVGVVPAAALASGLAAVILATSRRRGVAAAIVFSAAALPGVGRVNGAWEQLHGEAAWNAAAMRHEDAAEHHLERLERIAPGHLGAALTRAQLARERGELEQAIAALTEARQRHPTDPLALARLLEVYAAAGAQGGLTPSGALSRWCAAGDGLACAYRADELLAGAARRPALLQAASLAARACELGVGRGCATLGELHRDGRGVRRSAEAAEEHLRRACALDDGRGCDLLGDLLVGRGTGEGRAGAYDAWRRGCELDHGPSCTSLAGQLLAGLGVPEAPMAAWRRYEQACGLGDPAGCGALGFLLLDGRPGVVAADRPRAERLLRGACRARDAFSCRVLSDRAREVPPPAPFARTR